jgi:hypothetical protein
VIPVRVDPERLLGLIVTGIVPKVIVRDEGIFPAAKASSRVDEARSRVRV